MAPTNSNIKSRASPSSHGNMKYVNKDSWLWRRPKVSSSKPESRKSISLAECRRQRGRKLEEEQRKRMEEEEEKLNLREARKAMAERNVKRKQDIFLARKKSPSKKKEPRK